MRRTVEFKFSPKNRVRTVLGDEGVVDMCAVDIGPDRRYFVITKGGSGAWYSEDQLLFVPDEE